MSMTPQRWEYICTYLREVFGSQDEHLAGLMDAAIEAGLPDIAVSGDVGRLLKLLTSMTPGRLALEVGTLAGYSGIWIARGLAADGRLITIEKEPAHAVFARAQFERAGVADRVEVREGAALDVMPQVAAELEARSVDVVFLDAIKTEYPEYWIIVRPLIAPGGLILMDNMLSGGDWWIDDVGHETREAVDKVNRLLAADDEFEVVALPIREGVLVGRRLAEQGTRSAVPAMAAPA